MDFEYCSICNNLTVWDNRCYICYPPIRNPYSNYKYREKYFHKHLLGLIDDFKDRMKIKEVFEVFNDAYKGKALPYKFIIAKIADLLEIKHNIHITHKKRNMVLWNNFLEIKPFSTFKIFLSSIYSTFIYNYH